MGKADCLFDSSNAHLLCGCRICLKERKEEAWWMILCPKCGNKRCPHATDHRHECTGSNDPGQVGSVYGAFEREDKV
jgi:hypothetical protein